MDLTEKGLDSGDLIKVSLTEVGESSSLCASLRLTSKSRMIQ